MLIRRIDAIVEFTIQPQGQAPYIVETRHSYDSRFDPLSYGPMGLNRPDEPMNVPSVEEAIRQTLTICLDTFCDMIQPPQGRQDVQLLPLDEPGTGKVMALAAKGQYAQAAKALGKIKPFPDDLSYVFDLAVLQEAAGEKVAALENYRKVVVHRAAGFVQGRHGIARLTRSSP
jgi:hypothetical protein